MKDGLEVRPTNMARPESDREDILREATALLERAELLIPGESEPVVIGFRLGGAASVFFGGDPVYQFNSQGELRRAYVAGLLYKAEQGRLVELRRERTGSETALLRRELSDAETNELLGAAETRLLAMAAHLRQDAASVDRHIPASADIVPRIVAWLDGLPCPMKVAHRANVQ